MLFVALVLCLIVNAKHISNDSDSLGSFFLSVSQSEVCAAFNFRASGQRHLFWIRSDL